MNKTIQTWMVVLLGSATICASGNAYAANKKIAAAANKTIAAATNKTIATAANQRITASKTTADTLSTEYRETLETAVVSATRATATTPIAYTNVSKSTLEKKNQGTDLTYLLMGTPSLLTTSDAGAGIGYTSLRIRGTDATRINVTANGIPINDAESHSVFWVNMPDFASSVQNLQIQRGVGTSTNGSGAFGASINLQTATLPYLPYGEIHFSGGSFGTHKETVRFGTGLIGEHWSLDGRLSDIGSNGYLERAAASMQSYYLQGGYYNGRTTLRLILFGGQEETYHAWNYSTQAQMDAFGRRFNSCGYMGIQMADGSFYQPDIDYDYGIEEAQSLLQQGGKFVYYDDQTDNYLQTNAQLLLTHQLNQNWTLNAGLHYTKGDGYYQEYKLDRKLVEYGLYPYLDADGNTIQRSDLVRKKAMDNHFGGLVASALYDTDRMHLAIGGGANHYDGDHFGQVLWIKNYQGALNPDDHYYFNTGRKTDANVYTKAEYDFIPGLTGYADLQYRYLHYTIDGQNDKWAGEDLQQLSIDEVFHFFNPKAGLNWTPTSNQRLFASVSVAHKEPTRNNYTDGYLTEHPKSERLIDYELGYTYNGDFGQSVMTGNRWYLSGNLYYMDYRDQLVLTGELNEIGEPVAANVPESYRAGIELMGGIHCGFGLHWDWNATLSRNRILHFNETLYGYDTDWNELPALEIQHGTTHLAFSPEILLNNRIGYQWKGLEITLETQYVGQQYMSNADIPAHRLDDYCISNLNLSWTFHPRNLKSLRIGATVYNLFNEMYANNGWASSDYTGHLPGTSTTTNPATAARTTATPATRTATSATPVMDLRNNYTGYAVQAGTNVLVYLSLMF